MILKKLKNKKIRFFLLQSNDTGLFLFKEFYFGYLLNLLIEKLGFSLKNIEAEIVFPFSKYLKSLYKKIDKFDEDVFVFYLENSYHSNAYGYDFLIHTLEKIKKLNKKPEIYVYSLKISKEESINILKKYNFVTIIIRTDIEYFFNKYFFNNTEIEKIPNLILNINGDIIETKIEKIIYDLGDYILGGHYTGYLNKFVKSKDYIMNILDEDNSKTDELITYRRPKKKKIENFRYSSGTSAMISTGRGCKYNCDYCYRGIKYSEVRQIPISVVKKDMDYLKNMYYENIYVYDDCFLTTNYNRLNEILSLMSSYDFYYGISIRYETCTSDVFEKLKKINFYRIQIGLQSISIETNINTGRGLKLEKFKKLVTKFRLNGTMISIDIILGLPGETLKDFINTLNFAVALKPGSIHINTLFLNPGTKLTKNKEKYGIKTNESLKWLFAVPTLISSNSFSENDIKIAKIYIEKISKKALYTNMILR